MIFEGSKMKVSWVHEAIFAFRTWPFGTVGPRPRQKSRLVDPLSWRALDQNVKPMTGRNGNLMCREARTSGNDQSPESFAVIVRYRFRLADTVQLWRRNRI